MKNKAKSERVRLRTRRKNSLISDYILKNNFMSYFKPMYLNNFKISNQVKQDDFCILFTLF